jgi:hypothetical protein
MAMLNEAFISEEDARFHDDQDNYIFNGLGYFVSSMNTRRIIVSGSYKKDRFDDPIFASFSQASSHR